MKTLEFITLRRMLMTATLAVGLLMATNHTLAQIDVTFTATPEFSDWLLNFSVTNNTGPGEVIYLFGAHISSGSDIPGFGIPDGWSDAGSGIPYNNNWSTDPPGPYTIGFGETLSGFIARDNDSILPPRIIEWVATVIDSTGTSRSFTGTARNLDVGGTITGDEAGISATCLNITQLSLASVPLGGATNWDCEAAGLTVAPNDLILQQSIGIVTGPAAIGGSITGATGIFAGCHNRTTDQKVTTLLGGDTSWDCTALGLVASPRDQISTVSVGRAN